MTYKLPIVFVFIYFLFIFSSPVLAYNCRIQGLKKYYNDDKDINGNPVTAAALAKVTLSNGTNTTTNPYFLDVTDGTYTVSVEVPSGLDVGYTMCVNRTDCHSNTPVRAKSVTVFCNQSTAGYIDLWWHYRKMGDLDLNKVVDLRDVLKLISQVFI